MGYVHYLYPRSYKIKLNRIYIIIVFILFTDGDATSAVVGMGSGCILILIVLAVYFHKKLCFQYGVHINLPCCDKSLRPSSSLG